MGRRMAALPEPRLRVLSLGAGVQSTTLALMAAHGEVGPMPDAAIFCDLSHETTATYENLRWLSSGNALPFPVKVLQAGDLKADLLAGKDQTRDRGFAPIPYFIDNGPGKPEGRGIRACTLRYKIEPMSQEHRRMLGYPPQKNIPPNSIEVWIGISFDEVYRMKASKHAWQTNRWPLIERRMTRADCITWLKEHDYPVPVRSSCAFCPFHSDAEWRRIREDDQAAWKSAVELDRGLRESAGVLKLRGAPYLHRSLKPLDQVNLEPDRRQPDMFIEECEGLCGV